MKRETEDERDTDPQGTREERAFVMWINGLAIPLFVTNLQHDMSDGLVLLHTLDKIERGSINWKEANTNPNNAYKKVENCNLGIKVCVSKLNFSLVGIGGKDIADGMFTIPPFLLRGGGGGRGGGGRVLNCKAFVLMPLSQVIAS